MKVKVFRPYWEERRREGEDRRVRFEEDEGPGIETQIRLWGGGEA